MNKKTVSPLLSALGILVLLFVLFAGVSSTQADEKSDAVAKAIAYLNTQSNEPTKTMALVAAGPPAGGVDVSYLKSFSGSTAIEYAKPIMAIAAAGENPATYAEQDLVAKLKSFADSTQLGSASQVNDDIWGILAMRAAGIASNDFVIQNSKSFILGNQNADGGWAWNVGGASDTNDTAGAIMALLETGMSSSDAAIQNAVSYIKSAQNEDGGFPYDPVSQFGTDSDANSDSWVIMAFNKLGEDTALVTAHLLSLQDEDGGFWWMQPPADFNNKGPTADAVIALSGKSFPVAVFQGGNGSSSNTETSFRIVGSTEEVCRGTVLAANAMDVVINAADQCGYTYDIQETSFGKYLAAINDDVAEGIEGWMYSVNGEVPSIGAADYALSGGEKVLWFFGEFGQDPPELGDTSESVELSVEIIDEDSGGGGGGGGGKPEIAFVVSPTALDFGQLLPGNSAIDKVTLINEGQKNLNITAEVQGDSVFNFLKLDSAIWSLFSMLLETEEQENVGIELAVPAEFNSFGQKQGTLIFWGTAE